ncbi:MAG: ribosomal-processing cysteine protease Prp [Gemmiger sp.]
MVQVRIRRQGAARRFEFRGHAGYAPRGQDVVCAAVSTVYDLLAGYAEPDADALVLPEQAGLLAGAAQRELCRIAAAYPDHVRVTAE